MALEAKDPNAILDYKANWADWLTGSGADTIEESTWILEDGITEVSSTFTDTTAAIFISGGVAGQTYDATSRIVTVGGRTNDRTLRIPVRNR